MRIGVVVEEVADCEATDDQGEAVDVALARELVRTVGDVFLLAAEAEGLLQVIALRTDLGEGRAGFLRFAVREAANPKRVPKAKTLCDFRVEIGFTALPQPAPEILNSERVDVSHRIVVSPRLVRFT